MQKGLIIDFTAGFIKQNTNSFLENTDLTTRGDLFVRDATTITRLGIGTTGKYLRSDGTDPSWTAPVFTDITGTISDAQHGSRSGGTLHAVATSSVIGFVKPDGSTLTVDGSGNLSIATGDRGDITVTSAGATWTIDPQTVTFAKMQNILTQTLIGKVSAGTGSPEQVPLPLSPLYGGTGVNNSTRALTINTNGGTLTFGAASKNLTINKSLILDGTDAKTLTLNGNFTLGADFTVTGGGIFALGGFTATVPASMTLAGRDVANTFAESQTFDKGEFTKQSVGIGVTVSLPSGYSEVVAEHMTVDGTFTIDGDLAIVGSTFNGPAKITLAEQSSAPATPATDNMYLYANATGIASSKNDAGTVYQMVRYEEGTWTPSFSGTSTNGTYTYVLQLGGYTRIGNMCLFYGRIQISNISVAPTGTLQIRGLPFTSANVTNTSYGAINWSYIDHFNYSASIIELVGVIGQNTTFIDLYEIGDNTTPANATSANLSNTTQLIFSGSFPVA